MKNLRKSTKLFIWWLLLYVPFIVIAMCTIYFMYNNMANKGPNGDLRKKIGQKIELGFLINLNNEKEKLNLETDITLVDFWFQGCVPCLQEMEQFEPLLVGMEDKLNVISISIDDRELWKKLFEENERFSFLKEDISNWKHFAFPDTTYLDEQDRIIKTNAGNLMIKSLGIGAFPAYLALNNDGILVDVPLSGVS
jgi:thiol-disulfide isomerase/thioredoxin